MENIAIKERSNGKTLNVNMYDISAADPKAAVIFLKGDQLNGTNEAALTEEYKENEASVFTLAGTGSVDRVIDPADTRAAILSSLDTFEGKRVHSPQRKHINFVY